MGKTEEKVEVIRGTMLWQMAGAFYVRIQGMAKQHGIGLHEEFDEHDGGDTKYIVLLIENFPVATCRFYEIDRETVLVGRVVVLPEYRGAGLGRVTVLEAEKWIKELGYRKIVIDARDVATGFYEKIGFTAGDPLVSDWGNFHCVRMEKFI